jgi:hypothetical protein
MYLVLIFVILDPVFWEGWHSSEVTAAIASRWSGVFEVFTAREKIYPVGDCSLCL